jgi:hypothetical protein
MLFEHDRVRSDTIIESAEMLCALLLEETSRVLMRLMCRVPGSKQVVFRRLRVLCS